MSGWPPYVPTAMPPRLPKDDGWMFIYITGDAEGWQCAACHKMATFGHLRSKKHKVARNNLSLYRSFLEEAEETINRVNGRLVDPDLAAGSVPVAPWWVPPAGAQAKQAVAPNGTVWVSWPRLNNLGAARADPAPQRPAACAEQPPDWAQASDQSAQVPPPAAAQTEQAVAPSGTIPACVPLASLGAACADPAPKHPAARAEQPPDWAQPSDQSALVPPPAAAQTEQAVAPSGTIPACVPLASLGTERADHAPQQPEILAQLNLDIINLRAEIRDLRIRLAQVEEHDIQELRVAVMRAQASFIEFAATLLSSNSAAAAGGLGRSG